MALNVSATTRRLFERPEGLMLAALTAAAMTLIAAAVIGGRQAEGSTVAAPAAGGAATSTTTRTAPGSTSNRDLVKGPAVGRNATSGPSATATTTAPGGAKVSKKTGERVSSTGATRTGIHKDYFEYAVHTPVTNEGVPWGLADPTVAGVKGYTTYINRHGGINGLKARVYIADDRYTTAGARQVGDTLVKEVKPFLIEGTLGIDQVQKVALASKGAGIPYLAGGGPENELKSVGMYQYYTSYDEDMRALAKFICKHGKSYVGDTEIRLGTSTLRSEFILGVEKVFVKYLTDRNCVHEPVDSNARGTINKPTEQGTYSDQLSKFKSAYGGKGVNLIVPLQDPLTTSRQVAEMQSYRSPTYNPKWTFSNFAHDSDTSYKLFQGQWVGVRGLSPACYFSPAGGGQPYNTSLCAHMDRAHSYFVSLGQVEYDQNAGGSQGGKSRYNYQEGNAASEGWQKDGAGAAFGYNTIYIWYSAMKSIGIDPTREKFLAALNSLDKYSDLITSPITFRGSPNRMIGANKFVVYEGQANQRYRQVTEITPGLVDHF